MQIGLAPQLAQLTADVEAAIATYPAHADGRYLARLENQRARLSHPDLTLIAAVVRALCEDAPDRLAIIAPVATKLASRHPCLKRLAKIAA